jgi:hypothetical protein
VARFKISVDRDGLQYWGGASTDTKPAASSVPVGSYFWETDSGLIYRSDGDSWFVYEITVGLNRAIAGERNPVSLTNSYLATKEEANYTVVDVSVNSTTVSSAPAFLYGWYVNTALSAHALPLQDDAATVFTIPASLAAGTLIALPAAVSFETSLIANPDDAATGSVTLIWRPIG